MTIFPLLFGDGLPKYEYTPIPPGAARTFRLARLLPPEPSLIPGIEPTIRISLLECEAAGGSGGPSTPASVEYDALSYAWEVPPGVKRPTRRIIVETGDGGGGERFSLLIHRPLERALLRFAAANAREDEAGEGRPRYGLPMFIDQICINQEDDDEKAQQVGLMQAIYAHARRAVVWLGPGTAASDAWYAYVRTLCADGVVAGVMSRPADSIMRIYDGVVRAPTAAAAPLADAGETQDRDDLLALTERLAGRYPIAAYLSVLRRAWFGRLWTIQEAALARDVVVACGDAALCFDCFRAGMFFYTVQNNYWLGRFEGSLPRGEMLLRLAAFDATAGFSRIYQERKAIHGRDGGGGGSGGHHRAPLHEIVIKHGLVSEQRWKVGASLAQDRVYGLLGLVAADDPVKARLGIHYDKEDQAAAQIRAYTEAAGLFLAQGRGMDVLLFNQFPKKTAGLPSWVPDWAMDLVLPVAWQALHRPAFAAGGPPDAAFAKVGDDDDDASAGSRSISIKGVLIGRVVAIGQETYKSEDDPQFLEKIRYTDAKLMFDEVDRFVHSALTGNAAATPPTPETLAHTSLRVYDSGLVARQLTAELGSPAAAMRRLQTVQSSVSHLGARLLRSAAAARAYSLFNVYATVGITPWYVDYYRATAVLHRLARGPVALARTVVLALADLVEDVVGICVAAARVWVATTRIALRRRLAPGARLNVPDASYVDAGLDPEVVRSEHAAAFALSLERNIGRRVFRTAEGSVGMGPGAMRTGDAVVVLHGLTTPLVLRREAEAEGRDDEWTVVGEAYCDGVMDGEALGVNERLFVLV